MQVSASQMSLDIPVDVKAIINVSKTVLDDAFAPPETSAEAYTLLGLVVVHHMKEKDVSIVQLPPSSLSKGFKNQGLNNVARRIMQPDSPQFSWMATVMLEVFGLGVIVTNYDTLMFVDVSSARVKHQYRISVHDIEQAFADMQKREAKTITN